VFRYRGILSAYASGFRWGGEGLPLPLRRRMWATPRETWHRAIFPLADLRRLLITRASGPDAEGVGAGLCPATVSRRRRRDGGDGATASAEANVRRWDMGSPKPAILQAAYFSLFAFPFNGVHSG